MLLLDEYCVHYACSCIIFVCIIVVHAMLLLFHWLQYAESLSEGLENNISIKISDSKGDDMTTTLRNGIVPNLL